MKTINVPLPLADLQVGQMEERDLPSVLEIERRSFSHPWDDAAFREGVKRSNPHVHFRVVRRWRKAIGFIIFWVVADEAHIANFAVSPDDRNRGIGKYLLAESLAYIKTLGGDVVYLEVRVSNIPAQNLYRQFGFRIVGTRKRYYPDNGEDAYIFCLSKLTDMTLF